MLQPCQSGRFKSKLNSSDKHQQQLSKTNSDSVPIKVSSGVVKKRRIVTITEVIFSHVATHCSLMRAVSWGSTARAMSPSQRQRKERAAKKNTKIKILNQKNPAVMVSDYGSWHHRRRSAKKPKWFDCVTSWLRVWMWLLLLVVGTAKSIFNLSGAQTGEQLALFWINFWFWVGFCVNVLAPLRPPAS